jgi:hypothetical protein
MAGPHPPDQESYGDRRNEEIHDERGYGVALGVPDHVQHKSPDEIDHRQDLPIPGKPAAIAESTIRRFPVFPQRYPGVQFFDLGFFQLDDRPLDDSMSRPIERLHCPVKPVPKKCYFHHFGVLGRLPRISRPREEQQPQVNVSAARSDEALKTRRTHLRRLHLHLSQSLFRPDIHTAVGSARGDTRVRATPESHPCGRIVFGRPPVDNLAGKWGDIHRSS